MLRSTGAFRDGLSSPPGGEGPFRIERIQAAVVKISRSKDWWVRMARREDAGVPRRLDFAVAETLLKMDPEFWGALADILAGEP